jgi:hypothetical protein
VRGVPPPGFTVVSRDCPSRSYNVYVSPGGVAYRSASAAWDSVPTSSSTAPVVTPISALPACPTAKPVISSVLSMFLVAYSLPVASLPPGVLTCVDAAFHPDCPAFLAAIAQAHLALEGPDCPLPCSPSPEVEPCSLPDHLPPVGTDDLSAKSREIVLLRKVLPPGSERRMVEGPDDNWSYDQASPAMREEAVLRKFESAAGPSGKAAARDRRYLTRYVAFCVSVAVSAPFPVGSIVFLNFAKRAAASSAGKRGGATVEYSIKVSFLLSYQTRFSKSFC